MLSHNEYAFCTLRGSELSIQQLVFEIATVTIMVDTIQKALRPLTLVAFVLGFGNLRYPLNYWRFRLSIFYTIIVWSFCAFAFHFMMHKFSPNRIFNNYLTFFSVNINIFVTIILVSITVCKYQVYFLLINIKSFFFLALQEDAVSYSSCKK